MTDRLVVASAVRTAAGVLGDAVLLRDGMLVEVGSAAELRAPGVREEAYPDGVVVPGLRDAHFHPVNYAAAVAGVTLKDAADLGDLVDRLRAAAAALPPGAPLTAMRLDDESLAERRLPTRADLDAPFPDRPVLLHRYCGHVAVANTAALAAAGVSPATADPDGGSLDRDDTGRPTGVLRETAVNLVAGALAGLGGPALTPEGVLRAMRGLAGLGLTSIGGIVGCGGDGWADLGDQAAALAEVAGDLPIKVGAFVIAATPAELERQAERLRDAGPRLRFLGLKAFADGSLGGHTAYMWEPFADRPGETGLLRLDPEWAHGMASAALDMDGMVAIHAIGDRANAEVLEVFEDLLDAGAEPAALRIEHASVLREAEIARFARSGVTASVQPAFIASETEWLPKRLGSRRLPSAYPFRTLHSAGVPLAGGSDCPVEPPHPLWGMAVARDRAGMVPDEGLAAADALALFTDWAAAALREPAPLAPGSPADFVVLDRDPVTASPDELRRAAVLATWVDGQEVDVPDDHEVWPG